MSDMDTAKSSENVFIIPGGCLAREKDEKDEESIVLYDKVWLREMTGHEEDVLSNDSMDINERLYRILAQCIEQLESTETGKVITDKKRIAELTNFMLMSDNIVLLLRLRQVSLGDKISFKVRCPSSTCKTLQSKFFDLRKFEFTPMKGDRKQRIRTYTTEKGHIVQWQMMDVAKQRSIDDVQEKKVKKDKATKALMYRVLTIDNEPVTTETLKDLTMKERMDIRDEFDAEGGIDTSVSITCTSCGIDFETDMEVTGASFFARSE